jgi:hypothetical protein
MRFGTHQFPGDREEHNDAQGAPCLGRTFEAKQIGTGGVYINWVECTACHKEMRAAEDRLLPESTITDLDEAI